MAVSLSSPHSAGSTMARFTVLLPSERKRKKLRRRNLLLWRFILECPNCFYCGRPAVLGGDPNDWPTIEHLVPQSCGGNDSEENLVLACRRCNCDRDTVPLRWVAVDLKTRRIVLELDADDTDYLAPAPMLEGGAV